MNLYRLIPTCVITFALIGAATSSLLGREWYLGAAAGIAVALLPPVLLGVFVGLITRWRPDFPPCLCGRREFRFEGTLEPKPQDDHLNEYLIRCPCGERYAVGSGRVYRLDHQTRRALYMTYSKWGRWRRVRGADSVPQDSNPGLIYQPTPEVDESDVQRVIRRDFPEPQHAEVTELINSVGDLRTKLGVLKLANQNPENIPALVEAAKLDYRDILANAEYPRCMREANTLQHDTATNAEIYAEDWAQYRDWLHRDSPKDGPATQPS